MSKWSKKYRARLRERDKAELGAAFFQKCRDCSHDKERDDYGRLNAKCWGRYANGTWIRTPKRCPNYRRKWWKFWVKR